MIPLAERGHRAAFADQLRGLAALMVVLSHHAGDFWHLQPAVAAMTGLPAAFEAPPPGTAFLAPLVSGPFGMGAAGVALFFLISGYVIPFGLRGRDRGGFLLARLVRLMPTYWAGFAFQALVIFAALRLMGGSFPRGTEEVVLNFLPGLHLLAWRPSMDGIVWTLDVEVLFYLAAAAAAPALLARSALWLAVPGLAALLGAGLMLFPGWAAGPPSHLLRAGTGLSLAAPMLVFMGVGTVLHLAEADRRWRRAAFALVPLLLVLSAALLMGSPWTGIAAQIPAYLAMAALFTGAHALRDRIPALRWPTRLARISYSLYVVHGVSGFAVMGVLANRGWPPLAVFAAGMAYSLLVALLLHRLVEEPTRRLSARLGRRADVAVTVAP
ncbi:acyltransferase family protein [Roseomonas sp. GCM10028921]